MSQSVGLVGTGKIGTGIANGLKSAGFEVVAYDKAPSARETIEGLGAQWAESPRDVAERVDLIFLSLPNSAAEVDVIAGDQGILKGSRQGLIIVDTSTVSPGTSRSLSAQCAAQGVELLDSPITGGLVGARSGQLNILVGGSRAALDKVEPTLRAIAETWHYMGESGAGQAAKLVHNLIGQGLVVLFSEAFLFGRKQGLTDKDTFDVLRNYTKVYDYCLDKFRDRVLSDDLTPRFTLNMAYKDLTELMALAHAENLPLMATSLVREIHQLGRAMGMGELDNTTIMRVYETLSSDAK